MAVKKDFFAATTAWALYKPMEVHNATLVRLVSTRMRISAGETFTPLVWPLC